ncbi:MAG TPA: hypothetical protein DCX54_11110 [Flavobacteriales bacterium]|nr:hypothetical protein [Flavobacteriales bacterium]
MHLPEIRKEKSREDSGFSLIELMIVFAIFLLIATPFVRYFYRDEIKQFERQFFNALGICETAQFIILSFLAITVIYFKFRPDFIEAKRKNKPVVGGAVKVFAVFSLLFAGVLMFFL